MILTKDTQTAYIYKLAVRDMRDIEPTRIKWLTLERINEHLKKARTKHRKFANNKYQVISIASEELGELAKEVNDNDLEQAKEEALDLIAVLIRFIEEDK